MKKTILLGANNKFSTKVNKWGFTITGIIFLVNGLYHIISDIISPIGMILGIVMIPGGIAYSFYGLMAFSESSKYAPRVSIDNETILLKSNFQRPPVLISWDRIKQISLTSYLIKFFTEEEEYHFPYEANSDTSISIKSAIREIAESKQIEVLGG